MSSRPCGPSKKYKYRNGMKRKSQGPALSRVSCPRLFSLGHNSSTTTSEQDFHHSQPWTFGQELIFVQPKDSEEHPNTQIDLPQTQQHDSGADWNRPSAVEISQQPPESYSGLPRVATGPLRGTASGNVSGTVSDVPQIWPSELFPGLPPGRPQGLPSGIPPGLPPGLPPLPPPPTEMHTNSCPHCRKVLKIQKQLSRRRAELLTLRAHFRNEQDRLARIREFDVTTRKAIVEAISSTVDRGSLADDLEMIKALQEKSLAAYGNLTRAEKGFNKLRNRMSNLEYQFGKREQELNSLIFHQLTEVESFDNVDSDSMVDGLDSTNQTDSEDMPSLLLEYYDKAGDVGVEWDRLQDLDAEHNKNVALREQNLTEHQLALPSEQEFTSQYLDERAKIVRRLLQAKADARGLRRQCQELDYSIQDEGSNRDLDDLDFSKGATDLDWNKNAESGDAPGHDRLLQIFLLGEANNGERMDDWLKGNVQPQTTASTTHRTPLWESRRAYSETVFQAEPEVPVLQAQSETGPEPRVEKESFVPKAETEEETTVYPQTWPALTRVESNLSGASPSMISAWQPEVSLERRYSSPELRQLAMTD